MKFPSAFLACATAMLAAPHALAALWTPMEIATTAWYDASDGDSITTGGPDGFVTDWADKSGNGAHLTQATNGDRPALVTNVMNGLNVLEFAGRTEDMDTITNINAAWAVIVLQYNGSPAFSQALGGQTAAGGDAYTIQYRGDVNADRWQNDYYTNGNPTSVNGASVNVNPTIVFHTPVSLSNFALQVGGDRGISNRGWDGYIAEVILGSQAMDTDLRQTIEGYLAHKWMGADTDNPLPGDHPYKLVAPQSLIPEPSAALLGALGSLLLLRRKRH